MFSTPAAWVVLLRPSNMSDETESSPEIPTAPIAESAPRSRRVSNPRPKKVAKAIAPVEADAPAAEPAPAPAPVAARPPSIPFPTTPRSAPEERAESFSNGGGEWPEPEAESGGGSQPQSDSAKRKRRRRKGKGQSGTAQNPSGELAAEEFQAPAAVEAKPAEPAQDQRPRPHPGVQSQQQPQQQRAKIDPELLTKMAWKIYLAEVSEEGVALIGDNDAKDLSRRCFRLAEIFIEEQVRRR